MVRARWSYFLPSGTVFSTSYSAPRPVASGQTVSGPVPVPTTSGNTLLVSHVARPPPRLADPPPPLNSPDRLMPLLPLPVLMLELVLMRLTYTPGTTQHPSHSLAAKLSLQV